MTFQPSITLRDYQESAIEAALNFIKYRGGIHGYVKSPGGSGKSVMIAKLAESLLSNAISPIIILSRSERLLTQTRDKISPELRNRVGIYCAGIGERVHDKDITIASIQSISSLEQILKPQIILVDECDEIHPDSDSETQYWQFFNRCGNPQIVGFTATDFRTATGKIQWGEEIINIPLPPLIKAGYLVAPVNKCPITPDLAGVDIRLGDYVESQLNDIYTDPALLRESVKRLIAYGNSRKHGLVFCQSRKHGELVTAALIDNGETAVFVDGDTDKDELNNAIIPAFERGEYHYIVNCQLMTVGYDIPCIDLVAILRATKSKRLFEQMTYRGTRPFFVEDKKDFLLLDMGNNLIEHGALGSPPSPPQSKREAGKKPTGRICPVCETYVKVENQQCTDCGHEFPPAETPTVEHKRNHDSTSNTVYDHTTPPEKLTVRSVSYYTKPNKKTKQPMIVVNYSVHERYEPISEYFQPYHENEWVAGKFAAYLGETDKAYNTPAGLKLLTAEQLVEHCVIHNKKPAEIIRSYNKKGFPEIVRIYGEQQIEQLTIEEVLDGDEIPW